MPRRSVHKQPPWEFPLDSRVCIAGLRHSPDLNGQCGTVTSLLKNCLKSFHTVHATVKAQNGRQKVTLDGSNKTVLVRPSNLHYEPRPLETLDEDELTTILRYKEVAVPAKGRDKNVLERAVMTCLRPIIDEFKLDATDTAHEIGGLLAEARAEEKPNHEFQNVQSQKFLTFLNPKEFYIPRERDEPLEWLGGLGALPPGMANNIPQETIYARLPRAGKPPQTPFMAEQAVALLHDNPTGQTIFQHFLDGPLSVTVAEDVDQERFQVLVELPEDLLLHGSVTIIFFQSYNGTIGGYRPRMIHLWSVTAFGHRKLYHELQNHILHRFFRALATSVCAKFRNDIYDSIKESYHQERKFKQMVDLSFTMADARFICSDANTALGLVDVGEALEATGAHGEAALVYKDLAMLMGKKEMTNENNVIGSWHPNDFAGVAFHRAGKYCSALDEYLLSLKIILKKQMPRRCRVNHHLTNELLRKVYINYESMLYSATDSDERVDSDKQRLRLASAAFAGLLSASGYAHCGSKGPLKLAGSQFLRPQYTSSPAAAREALAQAIEQCSSGLHFNQILLDYLFVDETIVRVRLQRNGDEDGGGKVPSTRRQARKDMDRYGGKEDRGAKGCDNPSCALDTNAEKFYDCPCGSAVYCSTECQRVHWAKHKPVHKMLMKSKSKKK